MGSCVICGTSVDGNVCDLHEEDVLFVFRGEHPNQLTINRYYRGSVDGFAEFGVFVDVGDHVTGLLHRSELDQRLDSLDWDAGDTVYVKVKNVRDNGNVDLGWSIRQDESEFRGVLVDDPDWDHAKLAEEVEGVETADPRTGGGADAAPQAAETAADDEASDGQPAGGDGPPAARDDEQAGSDDATADDRDAPAAAAGGSVSRSEDASGTPGGGTVGQRRSDDATSAGADANADQSTGEDADPSDGRSTGDDADASDDRSTGNDADGSPSAGPPSHESGDGGDSFDRSSEATNDAEAAVAAATTADASAENADAADTDTPTERVEEATAGHEEDAEEPPERVQVDDLDDLIGEEVRLEGEIVDVQQTSGPTVFGLRDETGTVDCAAFVEAGVRAYPDVSEGDLVRLDGESRRRRGELQVETEDLVALDGEEREDVADRLAAALDERARPDAVEPLAADATVDALSEELVEAATAIRRAVLTDRPVIVRHSATADGYLAGVALERATLPLVESEHAATDAVYHYFDRRPLEGGVYDLDDATGDVTQMLENRERHDETVPLFVFVAAGGTRESLDGIELVSLYDAPTVVIDDAAADDPVVDAVDAVVSPSLVDGGRTTATALAANVAAHVGDEVREDLRHLPAVSFWETPPASYAEVAAEAGYDEPDLRAIREAVALEAYYQSYEDKRELLTDLLFGDEEADVSGLADNVAGQFRDKMDTAIETARANLDVQNVGGTTIAALDTEAFTHRFDFPSETLLLDELFRRSDEEVQALVGIGKDTLAVRPQDEFDLHDLAEAVADDAPEAGVDVRSAREGTLRFLAGERAAVLSAALPAVAERA